MSRRPLQPPLGCMVVLYLVAAPIYVCRFLVGAARAFRLRRISTRGCIICPHCGAENSLDILATCPKCQTTEYGNRLRCTGCGVRAMAFPCDACGVTVRLL